MNMASTHHIPLAQFSQTGPRSGPPAGAPAHAPGAGDLPGTSAAMALGHDHPAVRSLYIHTPFCSHKCHYCDFYSIVDTQDRQTAFIDRLIDELTHLAPHTGGLPLQTVFIGGGTPSLLRLDLWERLLASLNSLFDLSRMRSEEKLPSGAGFQPASVAARAQHSHPPGEFTVECNPETATPDLMAILAAGGVNRVSIGAQSFNPQHLKTLERWHNPDNVPRAVEAAHRAGIPRQSVDLIFAIPGQSLHEWRDDLQRAIALGTTHLSCYNLTYEPRTAMTARLAAGEFTPIDEDTEADMFRLTARLLADAGLARYEVSNFAQPGDESLHNLAYWRQEQWLAAGPSASGHVYAGPDPARGGYRWKNSARLGDYLASEGFSPITDLETPDPGRALRERIMMGLRITDGLDSAAIIRDAAHIAPGSERRLQRAAARYAERGLLDISNDRWRLTEEGFLLTDAIAADLMGGIGAH